MDNDYTATVGPRSAGNPKVMDPSVAGALSVAAVLVMLPVSGSTTSGAILQPSRPVASSRLSEFLVVGESTGSESLNGFTLTVSQPSASTYVPATAVAVRSLRDESGLTWDELARLFGVSRRAVHAWANGSRLTQSHAERLSAVRLVVDERHAGTPSLTRAALHSPDHGGQSAYQRLLADTKLPTNRREGFTVGELLGPRADAPDQPAE
jgi:DNA-binding transcriptional regulator YiaG